jgi:hypothetical protein
MSSLSANLRLYHTLSSYHKYGSNRKKYGGKFKKVELDNKSEGNSSTGIAGILQKALRERTTAICLSSSDDDDDAEDDDDEWDD